MGDIFDPALWTVASLPFSLVQLSTPFPVWIRILQKHRTWGLERVYGLGFLINEEAFCTAYFIHVYRTVCKGSMGVLDLGQMNTCRKVPLQVIYFRWHCSLPSMSFIFLRCTISMRAVFLLRRSSLRPFFVLYSKSPHSGLRMNSTLQWFSQLDGIHQQKDAKYYS